MFTGIVEARGQVLAVEATASGRRMRIRHPAQGRLCDIRLGHSIAVNGVCLTACVADAECFDADLSDTTLERTTLGSLDAGHEVNLEPALRAGDPLGGHLVSGHVDAVAIIAAAKTQGDCCQLKIEAPLAIRRYLVPRGSICVDGVSLTITAIERDAFSVTLVPHTRAVSLAGSYRAGLRANLEVDMLARYLERLLEERREL